MEAEGIQMSPKNGIVCADIHKINDQPCIIIGGGPSTFKSCGVHNNIIVEIPFSVFSIHRFENCWPAFRKDTTGVVMVFNPDVPQHIKELEKW